MNIIRISVAIFILVLGAATASSADEQKLIAFNVAPELHAKIIRVAESHGVSMTSEYPDNHLSLMLYVFEKRKDMYWLPNQFSKFDFSQVASGPLTMNTAKILNDDGEEVSIHVLIAVRGLASSVPQEVFECAVVKAAVSVLIAQAFDREPAQTAADIDCRLKME